MPLKGSKKDQMSQCYKEFKSGTLHSGKGGPVVSDRRQAVAICLNKSGQSNRAKGGKK